MQDELEQLVPKRIFDGGDLDCGSGLVLLIREEMLQIPEGSVLEMRSREPSVKLDLPPWCRMVRHEYLGALEASGFTRYFIRRGLQAEDDVEALERDKEQAKAYHWRLRVRASGHNQSTVYCRNFKWQVGQPASFEEKDLHPSAVEYLLGALSASLSTAFATECARAGLEVDDVELTCQGQLNNILAHLGMEEGDPSVSSIQIKCFASSFDDEKAIKAAWDRTVVRSPIAQTLDKAVTLSYHITIL